MITCDDLRKTFECTSDEELGRIFKRGATTVSSWRVKGVPASVERRAYEIMQEKGLVDGFKEVSKPQKQRALAMQLFLNECESFSSDELLELTLEMSKRKAVKQQD